MAMYAKVRRLKFRDGLSICEIARRTSLSRNTIKAWLRGADRNAMKYRRPPGKTKLDAHVDWLRQAMEIDQARPKRDRRSVLRLHEQLRNHGFTGSYSRVTCFVRHWRAEAGSVAARSAYVPLKFAWGEAFQFD